MANKLNKAIIKSVSGRFFTYIVQFSTLAIYARLFTPEEFGIIASIQVFVLFFQMLADVGIGPAIINEKSFGTDKRDGIFSVTAITGIFLALLFFLFSFALNSFYVGYEYQKIASFVCIAIFFFSLNIVSYTALIKDAKFIQLAWTDISIECIALIIIYLLYVNQFGVLALAARPAILAIGRFVITWLLASKTSIGRPTFGKDLYHIKSILGFSLYQFGFNFINYFSRNLDNILIAKYFGMSFIGIYEKSYQLMSYPLLLTTYALNPAIQPVLTKVRDNNKLVINEHNKLTARLLVISLPISVFMYTNSHSLILFLFGEQWLGVEPLIKIFSFMIPIQAVMSTNGAFFQAMNKPKLLFTVGVITSLVNISAISIGIILGKMSYVAYCLVISFSINFFITYFILFMFCLKGSVISFYLFLLRNAFKITPSILIFYIVNILYVSDLNLSPAINLLANGSIGIVSILLFIIPLKKIFK